MTSRSSATASSAPATSAKLTPVPARRLRARLRPMLPNPAMSAREESPPLDTKMSPNRLASNNSGNTKVTISLATAVEVCLSTATLAPDAAIRSMSCWVDTSERG